MTLTIKTPENMTYDKVHFSAFSKIHGRPTQSDYKNLKKKHQTLLANSMKSHTTGPKAPLAKNMDY